MPSAKESSLRGVITALGTPLDIEGENLHQEGMRMQVAAQIEAGVNGLLCLGTMGMAQMHTPEVREQAIRVTVEEAAGRLPVLVGCGDCSTARTKQYIAAAERYRPDGIVLITPYFPKLSDDELLDYFVSLADSTSIPIYIYDIPFFTNRPLTANFIRTLAESSPNIIGLKASGDFAVLRECLEHFRDDPRFAVFSGHSPLLDVATLLGADGIIDGLFALTPRIGVEIYQAASRDDVVAANAAQRRLGEVRDIVLIESVFGAFSCAMNELGFPGNYACPPFRNITDRGREQVREKLRRLEMI